MLQINFVNGKEKLKIKLTFDKHFSITGDLYEGRKLQSCGCIHSDILRLLNDSDTIVTIGRKTIDNNDSFKQMINGIIDLHLTNINGETMYWENIAYHIYNNEDTSSYLLDEIDEDLKERLNKLYDIIFNFKYLTYNPYNENLSNRNYYKDLYKKILFHLGYPFNLQLKASRLKDLLFEYGVNLEKHSIDVPKGKFHKDIFIEMIDNFYEQNLIANNENLIYKDLNKEISIYKERIREQENYISIIEFLYKLNATKYDINKYDIIIIGKEIKFKEGIYTTKELGEIMNFCKYNNFKLIIK